MSQFSERKIQMFEPKNFLWIVITSVLGLVAFFKWKFNYWKRKNLPYLEPKAPFGNIPNIFTIKEKPGIIITKLYTEMKRRGWKHGGIYFFTFPVYLVIDLNYIKNILTKDFQYFVDRGFYYNKKDDPLSAHLFNIGGKDWKHLRAKITPTFTTSKMKMMCQSVIKCGELLLETVETESKNEVINIHEIIYSFTMDVIGSCVFGIDLNVLKNANSPFLYYGKKTLALTKFKIITQMTAAFFPDFARRLGLTVTSADISDFFINMVKDIVKYRKDENAHRSDFMQIMIDLKNEDEANLTIEEIAAQGILFFGAGFETSASATTFTIYELTKRQDIQERAREEIVTVLTKFGNKISYEMLHELKYLDQVLSETMRKYPALLYITRRCVKNYKVPNENVVIEKGTLVLIPVHGIHYDEEYYPDPEKYDPERFNDDSIQSRNNYAHLPFGEGPRICIGKRFGIMQSKIALINLLKNYKFTLNSKTKEPITLKLESFVVVPSSPIWINVEKILN